MALTEKERLKKLSDAKTGEDFYDLYLQVFGEEFPILNLRNTNQKIKGEKLPDGFNI
jgi:hypothetical protein